MTEEKKDNVVDLSQIKPKNGNGFRKPKKPTNKQVTKALEEEVTKVDILESLLHSTMQKVNQLSSMFQSSTALMANAVDTITVKLTALSKHLEEKGITEKEALTKCLDDAVAALKDAKELELDTRLGLKTVDRPSQTGDVMIVDYKGTMDEVAFEGGTAKKQMLEIGLNAMVDKFEEKCIGMSAGETRTIDITFPEDYQAPHLAGQKTKFEVVCHKVKEVVAKKTGEPKQ